MTDFAKTQFLIEDHLTHTTIRQFRRKSANALVDKAGKVLRLMTWPEWVAFKARWPEEVEADGLRLVNVWTLIEVKG